MATVQWMKLHILGWDARDEKGRKVEKIPLMFDYSVANEILQEPVLDQKQFTQG